jgi:hypothetical protein
VRFPQRRRFSAGVLVSVVLLVTGAVIEAPAARRALALYYTNLWRVIAFTCVAGDLERA